MKSESNEYSRGALAKRTGVNSETIRYYEKINLLPTPDRNTSGHRVYANDQARRLSFIKRSRELGFTLREVRAFLELVDGGSYTCADVHGRVVAHLADVDQKIVDLQRMRSTLQEMASECSGGLVPKCPIVDTLLAD